MKGILITALLAAMPALAGFTQTRRDIALDFSQKSVVVEFTTDGTAISKAKPLCDCTKVAIHGTKLVATVDTSKFDKSVEKEIEATTADGKTTRLTMAFALPEAMHLSARSLVWQRGGSPAPQVLTITLPKGSPVHGLKDAGLVGEGFDYTPAKVQEGRQYTVTVTPRSTAKAVLNRLVLTTDTTDPRFAKQIIYLQVKK